MHCFTPLLLLILVGCAGKNFDEASIPPEQLSTEMAFTRLAKHGEMEPVLNAGQKLQNWQFFVAGTTTSSVMGSDKATVITLSDRSGIGYTVSSANTLLSVIKQMGDGGGYGYGTGEVVSVDRDLAAGKIDAEILILSWRPRS